MTRHRNIFWYSFYTILFVGTTIGAIILISKLDQELEQHYERGVIISIYCYKYCVQDCLWDLTFNVSYDINGTNYFGTYTTDDYFSDCSPSILDKTGPCCSNLNNHTVWLDISENNLTDIDLMSYNMMYNTWMYLGFGLLLIFIAFYGIGAIIYRSWKQCRYHI